MDTNSKEILAKINAEGIILKGSALFFKNNFKGLPGELYLSSKRLIFTRHKVQNYISGAGVAGAIILFVNTMQAPLMASLVFLDILYVAAFSLTRFIKPGMRKVAYDIEMNSIKCFSKESSGSKKFMLIALNDGSSIKFSMSNTEEWEYVIRKLISCQL